MKAPQSRDRKLETRIALKLPVLEYFGRDELIVSQVPGNDCDELIVSQVPGKDRDELIVSQALRY